MSRTPALLRKATPGDASALVLLWGELLHAPTADPVAEMLATIDRIAASEDQRIVVAEVGGEVAGAVVLRVEAITPFGDEVAVQAITPYVSPDFRRRGIGKLLIEAAVLYAEEHGIGHVSAASMSNSRDAHRFLARMGLAPQAVLRLAPTAVVRAKVSGRRTAGSTHRQPLGQVLAQRRSMRRQRDLA
ncbi:GNAT family N-acetyltransferase [Nocardioides sp. AE5]|uniref:GNAT family N-acetyltransferase n=1 Tax=Nocardioides sp. AE5 TaxID=2962573 RepID=UPI002881C667|nr:GNAT family N-acetyltransferase [Nocardioides sp. AE5]MDT0201306.1 GNAT family N-acetyltransferase [Nocardioides sp. AE5]